MKNYAACLLCFLFTVNVLTATAQTTQMAAGVQKLSAGLADKFTPYAFCNQAPMTATLDAR
jgi:alpha-D-xyloside xylohydrolase